MKFNIKTHVVLSKEFAVEAESLKDAISEVEQLLATESDFNSFEFTRWGYDITDPSIREYIRKESERKIKKYKERMRAEGRCLKVETATPDK